VAAPPTAPTIPAPLPLSIIVINETMYDPLIAADISGEWFELYNRGDVPQGWMIGDDTANHTIASSVSIPPLGYVVLGNGGNVVTNGGVNVTYVYGSTLQLSNSADFVLLSEPNGVPHDLVAYGPRTGFADGGRGFSIALRNATLNNEDGSNWCVASTPWAPKRNSGTSGRPMIVKLVNVEVRATKCIKQEWSRVEARSKQPVTYIE
jgi:Lamin Tail Domain